MLLGGWGTEFDDVMRREGRGAEVLGGRSHVSSVVVAEVVEEVRLRAGAQGKPCGGVAWVNET